MPKYTWNPDTGAPINAPPGFSGGDYGFSYSGDDPEKILKDVARTLSKGRGGKGIGKGGLGAALAGLVGGWSAVGLGRAIGALAGFTTAGRLILTVGLSASLRRVAVENMEGFGADMYGAGFDFGALVNTLAPSMGGTSPAPPPGPDVSSSAPQYAPDSGAWNPTTPQVLPAPPTAPDIQTIRKIGDPQGAIADWIMDYFAEPLYSAGYAFGEVYGEAVHWIVPDILNPHVPSRGVWPTFIYPEGPDFP